MIYYIDWKRHWNLREQNAHVLLQLNTHARTKRRVYQSMNITNFHSPLKSKCQENEVYKLVFGGLRAVIAAIAVAAANNIRNNRTKMMMESTIKFIHRQSIGLCRELMMKCVNASWTAIPHQYSLVTTWLLFYIFEMIVRL